MKYPSALATVLAATVLGVVAGCGGEDRLSREDFSVRIQGIDERGGALWGRLAERAQDLEPHQPVPADVEHAVTELIEFHEQAVAELEGLVPPEDAQEPVEVLVEALRERAATFEQAVAAGRFTEQDFDQITRSGEKIDHAFTRFREEGFLPTAVEHDEERSEAPARAPASPQARRPAERGP